MGNPVLSISAEGARRLAVAKQHLVGKLPAKPIREHILSVVRDLTFVQWDPIEVVAPSHVLSLWNRVGDFRPSDLEGLLWGEKLIGRIDPVMDKENEKLLIKSVHAQPNAPSDTEVSSKIAEKIVHLGEFLGAKEVEYTAQVPKAWKNSLR